MLDLVFLTPLFCFYTHTHAHTYTHTHTHTHTPTHFSTFFSKTSYRIFLKLYIKLEGVSGQKVIKTNFSERFSFWRKDLKNSSKIGFDFCQKFNQLMCHPRSGA